MARTPFGVFVSVPLLVTVYTVSTMAFFKVLSFLLIVAAIVFFFVVFSGGFSKGIDTIRGIFGDRHASSLVLFSVIVAVLILFGAGVVRDDLTVRDILFIPEHESEA